mgnify:FL=1
MTPLDFSSYPYSHSLVALLVWASIFASLYMALSHSGLRVAIVIVTLIFSHWVLVLFLLIIYLGNVFGPPPPSTVAVAWSAQAMWLIVAWGFWVDRHRSAAASNTTQAGDTS